MKITVYGTKTCPYCIKLKDWLDKKKIDYTSYDIDENPIAAQNMSRLADEMVVPFSVIELDNDKTEKIVGFNPEKFEEIFKK